MTYDIDDLALYGYCSLRYRYKVQWELPYRELSAETAYVETVRRALSRLLYGLGTGSPAKAKEASLRLFDMLWRRACKGMPWSQELITGLKLEGHMALLDMFQLVGADDVVVGGGLPMEVSLSEDIVVKSLLDGLIMKDDGSPYRLLCIVHITDEKSPLAGVKYQPLKRQWALMAVRRQMEYQKGRVAHWSFSPFARKPPKLYDAPPQQAEFTRLARALIRGIEAEVFVPTPHRERCKTCFYKRLCTSKHCGDIPKKEIDEIRVRT